MTRIVRYAKEKLGLGQKYENEVEEWSRKLVVTAEKLKKKELVTQEEFLRSRLKSLIDKINSKTNELSELRNKARQNRAMKSNAMMELIDETVKNDPEGQVAKADLALYDLIKKNEFETSTCWLIVGKKDLLLDDFEKMNEKRHKLAMELIRLNEAVKLKEDWFEQQKQSSSMERFEALLVQRNRKIDELSIFEIIFRKPAAGT